MSFMQTIMLKLSMFTYYVSTIWWTKTSRELEYKKPSSLSAREKPDFR